MITNHRVSLLTTDHRSRQLAKQALLWERAVTQRLRSQLDMAEAQFIESVMELGGLTNKIWGVNRIYIYILYVYIYIYK